MLTRQGKLGLELRGANGLSKRRDLYSVTTRGERINKERR